MADKLQAGYDAWGNEFVPGAVLASTPPDVDEDDDDEDEDDDELDNDDLDDDDLDDEFEEDEEDDVD